MELLVVFGVILSAAAIWGIIDAASQPDSVWARADQNKIVWVLLQVILWGIGTLVYAIAIRPQLQRRPAPTTAPRSKAPRKVADETEMDPMQSFYDRRQGR